MTTKNIPLLGSPPVYFQCTQVDTENGNPVYALAVVPSVAGDASAANQALQITQETAINTVLGTKADAKSTATDATAISGISIWKQISASIQAAATSLASLVAGTVLAAGSAIIGKVGIDQTTPGTTNGVVVNSSALPTGASTSALQPTNASQGSTTSGQTGTVMLGAVLSAPPTYTTAQSQPPNVSVKGALMMSVDGVNTVNLTGSPYAILDRGGSSRVLAVGGFGYNGSTQDVLRTIQGSDGTGLGIQGVAQAVVKTPQLTGARINNAAASGDTALVTATASQTTRVHRLKLSVAGATVVQIKDGSTVLEVFNFSGNGGSVILNFASEPWYVTSTNSALNINSSAAVQVDGRVEYVKSA